MTSNNFTGLDELRAELESSGFKIYEDHLKHDLNKCNWYACKRTGLPARSCQTNEGKPLQLVVQPWAINNRPSGTVEYEARGEVDGNWFILKAYSIDPEKFLRSRDGLERSLVAGWNALNGWTP